MAKQGFMGKISRWFSGSSDTYFFGIQLAIKCFGEDTLRAKFARVLEDAHESGDGVQEKRRFIRRFVALMEESELFWNSGFWDYYERADEATDEFHTWVHEIEGALATEEEAMGDELDDIQRISYRKDFVVVTLAFLLDEPFAPVEDIEREDDYYLKETFTTLISGLTRLDPRLIQADAAYVVPGNEEDGLSEDDLYGPGWEHLHLLL